MRSDDGKCHICRQWPLEESRLYGITTCKSCEETAAALRNEERWWQFWRWFA